MVAGPILLVEDNVDDVDLTLRSFKKSNFLNEIIVASDGVEALDLLMGRNGRERITPALILLDIGLPRVDGLQVLREIRKTQHTALLPVVILTSSSEQKDIIDGYNLGVNSYIRKPVDFVKFAEVIGHIGLYWLVINEPIVRDNQT